MSTQRIKLADITRQTTDGLWQQQMETGIRSGNDERVVTEYAERMRANDKFPPIVVFRDGDGLHLADGFHRIAAAKKIGATDIEAELRDGTRAEALWYALGANRTHGQRLNPGDVSHAIAVALKEFPSKSQNLIAEQIGCNQSTVSRVRNELMQTHKLNPPKRTKGKDGKSRPSTRAKKDCRTAEPEAEQNAKEEPEPSFDNLDANPERMPLYRFTIAGRNINSVRKMAGKAFGQEAIVTIEKVSPPVSRAERLAEAEDLISQANGIVGDLQGELESWHDNMPENLQGSQKGEDVQSCSEALSEIKDALDNIDFGNVDFPGMF